MERQITPKFRILSYSGEPFLDRVEAGRLLAVALNQYRGQNAVVVGVPRGSMIVAREIAWAINADLDIIVALLPIGDWKKGKNGQRDKGKIETSTNRN